MTNNQSAASKGNGWFEDLKKQQRPRWLYTQPSHAGGLLVGVGLKDARGTVEKKAVCAKKGKRETKIYSRSFESRVSFLFFLFFLPRTSTSTSTFKTYHTHIYSSPSRKAYKDTPRLGSTKEYQNDTTNKQDAPHNVGSLRMQTPVVKIHSGTGPCPGCQDVSYTLHSNNPVTITPSSLQLYTRHLPKTLLQPQACRLCLHLQQQR